MHSSPIYYVLNKLFAVMCQAKPALVQVVIHQNLVKHLAVSARGA